MHYIGVGTATVDKRECFSAEVKMKPEVSSMWYGSIRNLDCIGGLYSTFRRYAIQECERWCKWQRSGKPNRRHRTSERKIKNEWATAHAHVPSSHFYVRRERERGRVSAALDHSVCRLFLVMRAFYQCRFTIPLMSLVASCVVSRRSEKCNHLNGSGGCAVRRGEIFASK